MGSTSVTTDPGLGDPTSRRRLEVVGAAHGRRDRERDRRGCSARRHPRRRRPFHGRTGSGLEVDPAVILELHLGPGVGIGPVDLPLVVPDRSPGEEPDRDAGGKPVDARESGERGGELLAVTSPRLEQEAHQAAVTGRRRDQA